jgi:alpha-L-fucosidase 2
MVRANHQFRSGLIRWTFEKAAEIAGLLGITDEAAHWREVLSKWPDYAISQTEGFMIAPGYPLHESHRHFSHLMAFHPLGIVDWSNGEKDREIIANTLKNLEKYGSGWWTGYSFSWLGNLYARARDGDKAAEALTTFATCFCLPNSFHVNGDQSGTGKSNFTYRPFTLEGNFAFASGIQEMLLQSHSGTVRIFPAIPGKWQDVSFSDLRAAGAFLISATRKGSQIRTVKIKSVKGGTLQLENPFDNPFNITGGPFEKEGKNLIFRMKPGDQMVLTAK